MSAEPSPRDVIARPVDAALISEGAAPGNSIHGWRCEYPDRYGPCDCVWETAQEVADALLDAVRTDPAVADALAHAAGPQLLDALTRTGTLTEDWGWACCDSQFEHVSLKGRHKAEYQHRLVTPWEEQP